VFFSVHQTVNNRIFHARPNQTPPTLPYLDINYAAGSVTTGID